MINRATQTWPANTTINTPETTCPHLVIDKMGRCENCFMFMGLTDEEELAQFIAGMESEMEYERRMR